MLKVMFIKSYDYWGLAMDLLFKLIQFIFYNIEKTYQINKRSQRLLVINCKDIIDLAKYHLGVLFCHLRKYFY